jgi:hypothetical protein
MPLSINWFHVVLGNKIDRKEGVGPLIVNHLTLS